jgi:hypothetical protein
MVVSGPNQLRVADAIYLGAVSTFRAQQTRDTIIQTDLIECSIEANSKALQQRSTDWGNSCVDFLRLSA